MMGLPDSPFRAIKVLIWAMHSIMENKKDSDLPQTKTPNPFTWNQVEFNFQGKETYDPTKPRVAKVEVDRGITWDIFIYCYEVRRTVPTEDVCWQVTRTFMSKCNCLGIQDAAWKRKEPNCNPGTWVIP